MVFPRAEKSNAYHGGFGKCTEELMRKWTDEVMIPSVDRAVGSDGSRIAGATSYGLIKLNGQAARVEGLRNVPDTPITVQVRCDELKALWDNIERIAAEKRLTEFQDMFLVVVAGEAERGLQISEENMESFWGRFTKAWSDCINMKFVPAETIHIAAKGYYGVKQG
jgi:hypothetical protein